MGGRTAVRWHGSSFCSIKGREYMFALWGGMWYDESEVMNLGRRMYHECVCSWNGCGYDRELGGC